MGSGDEIANDLLRRLLAGERGKLPLHLAMLLDKSSSMRDSDDFYRWILPPDLANLQLSEKASAEIVSSLCAEASRNPEDALIFVLSSPGYGLSVKTVAKILVSPPRPMTMSEYGIALAFVRAYLPIYLAQDADFMSMAELEPLFQLASEFKDVVVEEGKTDHEKSARNLVKMCAEDLIERLAPFGVGDS